MDNKKKILIIDDDVNLSNVLTDKLNLSGFEAVSAGDGEDGLKKALEIHPDVILLDLVMPKMDGLEMLKKLREDPWGKGAKVIVLTLLEEVDYIAKAVESAVYGYIIKTEYSLDGIVKKVESMIGDGK
jgi:DNA-binding response OmpR family regulator